MAVYIFNTFNRNIMIKNTPLKVVPESVGVKLNILSELCKQY